MPELKLSLDPHSKTPVYRQIVDQFRTLLVEGELEPGQAMPSARRIATELGIHFNTVAEAYRALAAEGLISVAHGKTARVLDHIPMPAAPEMLEGFRSKLRQLIAEMRTQGISKARIRRELASAQEGLQQ